MKESCIELTEPLDAAVVAVAQRAELAMPKRTSLPSMLPPGCIVAGGLVDAQVGKAGLPACSAATQPSASGTKITSIAARIAQPCRVSPTILPNV